MTLRPLTGFATPGPPLTRPDSVRGAQHSMGLKLPGKKMDTVGPGEECIYKYI